MTTSPREPLRSRTWNRVVWPTLAGLVGAVGLLGATAIGTWASWLSASLTLSLFVGVLTWSLVPGSVATTLRVAVATPLVVAVVVGWLVLSPTIGLLVSLATALSAPPVVDAVGGWRRSRVGRAARSGTGRMVIDRELVDRRFADIVQRQLQDLDEKLDS
ncbi:hypothetical protein ISU07_23170 [Nocardioides islandensis]|uniref:Uncharacterized protein n=1 Tax=Nocardioides islandensis TaxID=433663 RepID=A0A930YGL2_9ACTN|nr:hypothetical protein [Nocardioides islandensis]MBF4766048.1 hypothetical protein [Nocardioides islandensis]